MIGKMKKLGLFLGFVTYAMVSVAQSTEQSALTLTLEQALQIALSESPTIKVAEQEIDTLLHHHLAREWQADARAGRFRGEEGGEYFLGFLDGDRLAVIADVEGEFLLRQRVVGTHVRLLLPLKFNLCCARLLGIFY